MSSTATAPAVLMPSRICMARGQKVMLDVDLADLHQISKRSLLSTVRRNLDRFPHDFMFQLTAAEAECLTSTPARVGRRPVRPYAFNEQGVAMLIPLLTTKKAIELSLLIARELGGNADGSLFALITRELEPKKKRASTFIPLAGAVNEY